MFCRDNLINCIRWKNEKRIAVSYFLLILIAVVTLRLVKSYVHFSALTRQCDYGILAED